MQDFETKVGGLLTKVASLLTERKWRMATAESCTGGWIAKCCTDLQGSSDWFDRGYVTYSNDSKVEMLGVCREMLLSEGAVNAEVAASMAQGARLRAGVDVALAVTGIAGPGGGSSEKPVGMVWFAWSVQGGNDRNEVRYFAGDRDSIRRQTVTHALQGLLTLLQS
jgi:nicotinamide-nucleotide amidase